MNTPETDALQKTILSLHFVLDYLFASDVMSHLTLCSKAVVYCGFIQKLLIGLSKRLLA